MLNFSGNLSESSQEFLRFKFIVDCWVAATALNGAYIVLNPDIEILETRKEGRNWYWLGAISVCLQARSWSPRARDYRTGTVELCNYLVVPRALPMGTKARRKMNILRYHYVDYSVKNWSSWSLLGSQGEQIDCNNQSGGLSLCWGSVDLFIDHQHFEGS